MSAAVPFKLAEPSAAPAPAAAGRPPLAMQQLWFALQRMEWASLVLVPADAGVSAMDVARPLYEIGQLAMGDRLRILDARESKLGGVAPLILDMTGAGPRASGTQWSERVLVAIESILTQPSGIPVAVAGDAALLCVQMGTTSLAAARETVQTIGPQRFVGCITLPPP